MYFLELFLSIFLLFLVLDTSQAGPATQVSGGSARGSLAERLNVDYVRATWWAAYHPNMTVYDLPYDKYNIISYFAAYVHHPISITRLELSICTCSLTTNDTGVITLGDVNLDPERLPIFVQNATANVRRHSENLAVSLLTNYSRM